MREPTVAKGVTGRADAASSTSLQSSESSVQAALYAAGSRLGDHAAARHSVEVAGDKSDRLTGRILVAIGEIKTCVLEVSPHG